MHTQHPFWHSYPHPDRPPLPTPDEALNTVLAQWPCWWLIVDCGCKFSRQMSQLHMDESLAEKTLREVVAQLRCTRCGQSAHGVVLASMVPEYNLGMEIVQIVLL